RLRLRRRGRRAARRPAHGGRFPEPRRRTAGARVFRRRHPPHPRRQPDAGVDGDRGRRRSALIPPAGTTKPRTGGASRWPGVAAMAARGVLRGEDQFAAFLATTFLAGALATLLVAAFFATGAAALPEAFSVALLRALP